MGFVPRFQVFHTDEHGEGQVYIPAVNWALFLGCIWVTIVFQTSGNLAAAYGVAVTGTMGITTLIFGYVAYYRWHWHLPLVYAVCAMEHPDIRNVLKELQRKRLLPIASERWIIEVGEEEIIVDRNLGFFHKIVAVTFSWILRLSTPAHKYLGLVYDAAVSKEIVPVVSSPSGVKVALPELELIQKAE